MFEILPMSESRTVAVGGGGTMMLTDNGGNDWHIQKLPSGIRRVAFSDQLHGWALGMNEAFRTSDGGITWHEDDLNIDISSTYFQDIQFPSERIGWILTDYEGRSIEYDPETHTGALYQTMNGGDTWREVEFGAMGDLIAMSFPDSLSGFILTENLREQKHYIFRTLDGGITWDLLPAPDNVDWAIHFISPRLGWLGGYRTTDGGLTWERFTDIIADSLYPGGTTLQEVNSIFFTDSLSGWMAATFSYCVVEDCHITSNAYMILKSSDGGKIWEVQKDGIGAELNNIHFLNQDVGWTCGYGGLIYKTYDSGDHWVRSGSGTVEHLNDVDFVDGKTGWAVGNRGTILYTDNARQNWIPQDCGVSNGLKAVDFVDNYNGWAVGEPQIILHTADGGATWTVQHELQYGSLRDVCFIDASTGWTVGSNGTILKTTSGGRVWEKQSSNTVYILGAVTFVNHDTGWACGEMGTFLSTVDGGYTWVVQQFPFPAFFRSIQFYNSQNGWISDGESLEFYKTIDGGNSWIRLPFEEYRDSGMNGIWSFYFLNESHGWASSFLSSDIAMTSDGGITWTHQERLPSNRINSIQFISPGLGWAVGSHGSILRYSNPDLGVPINPDPGVPFSLQLAGNFPNPFNIGTIIYFILPREQVVDISVYDILGEKAETIDGDDYSEGLHTIHWRPRNLSSGMYIIRIEGDDFRESFKCTFIK